MDNHRQRKIPFERREKMKNFHKDDRFFTDRKEMWEQNDRKSKNVWGRDEEHSKQSCKKKNDCLFEVIDRKLAQTHSLRAENHTKRCKTPFQVIRTKLDWADNGSR